MKCEIYSLSPSYSYKKFNCRCSICRNWKSNCESKRREQNKERAKQWRLKNVERSRENSKKYQRNNPKQLLKWQLKKYNLTVEEFEKLGNKCFICRNNPGGMQNSKKRLSVDHNHTSGKVRGALCGSCNVGLGHFKHNIKLLKKAVNYLIKYE